MADLSDLLKRSATRQSEAFEPSPDLPQRIAARTLQLQRRRRGGIIGGAVVVAVAALVFSLLVQPTLNDSTAVSVPFEPAVVDVSKRPTTTATATVAGAAATATEETVGVPDLSGLSPKERAKVQRKRKVAARNRRDDDPAVGTEVSGSRETRGGSAAAGTLAPPRHTTTTTRARGTSTTTRPRATTTTTKPPPTTTTPTTSPPVVPLTITGPDQVCAGVPTEFRATGTGAELVVWSNRQVGAVATYTLTESTTVTASLDLPGVSVQKQVAVQVVPKGTPPC